MLNCCKTNAVVINYKKIAMETDVFFEFKKNGLSEVALRKIDAGVLTVGYVSTDELPEVGNFFGFDENTIKACSESNELFRSGVEVHKDYTFTELRIMNDDNEDDDYIALYMKKNMIIVVDISDEDGSTKAKFFSAIDRYPVENVNCEKVLAAFLDSLLTGDHRVLETIENELAEEEDAITEGDIDEEFNVTLLEIKKRVSKRHTYYAQLLDVADAVSENDNEIFDEANLIYIDNVSKRISRLREDTGSLKSTIEHLQDAYSSALDFKMNKTMKIFTVLTSIFFPLTIIVGWYGMNFQYMPEFAWRYGYLYVILLSIVIVLVFAIIGKKKKWF